MSDEFRWDDAYSVGVDAFDEDHKRLLALGNAVIQAATIEREQSAVRTLLDALHEESSQHFAREEALMREAGFPLLRDHHDQHLRLSAELHLFIQQYDAGHLHAGRLARFLLHWLVQHIVEQDSKFKTHCAAVGFGLNAADAAGPPVSGPN